MLPILASLLLLVAVTPPLLAQAPEAKPFAQDGVGATPRSWLDWGRERGRSITDHGGGLTVDGSLDSTQGLRNAIAAANGRMVEIPGGAGVTREHFRIGSALATSGNLSVRGSPSGINGVPRSAVKFSATPGATGAQWDFSAAPSYVFLQDLHIAHSAAKATRNGIGLNFATAHYPFLDRVWVSGFDTCIKAGGAFFYGELRNVVTMDCNAAGFLSSGNLLNNLSINGGQFSRSNVGLHLIAVGSNVNLRGTYREANAVGLYVNSGHIISDYSSYQEAQTSYDIFFDVPYPFHTTHYSLVDSYFDIVQGRGLPRFRSTGNVTVYAQGNKFYNEPAVAPFAFDNLYGATPGVFIGNEYRSENLTNIPDDAGMLIIDQKHPLVLYSSGAPTNLPAQRGTVFINKSGTTMSTAHGWRVTSPGWIAPVPRIPTLATTTVNSAVVGIDTNTGWRVRAGDWISVGGVTWGTGSDPAAMVLYTEPGPKLVMAKAANHAVSRAAMTYASATLEVIPAPNTTAGLGSRQFSENNIGVASGANVLLFEVKLSAGTKAVVKLLGIHANKGRSDEQFTTKESIVGISNSGGTIRVTSATDVGTTNGAGSALAYTILGSDAGGGVARIFVTQATGGATSFAYKADVIGTESLPAVNVSMIGGGAGRGQ